MLSTGATILVVLLLVGLIAAASLLIRAGVRRSRPGLRRLLGEPGRPSTPRERSRLLASSTLLSVVAGAILSSAQAQAYAFTSSFEQIVVTLAYSATAFLMLGPLVLLISPAFRQAFTLSLIRVADVLRVPWRTWTPRQRVPGLILNGLFMGPIFLLFAGALAGVPYLRGEFDSDVPTRSAPSGSRTGNQPPPPTGPRYDIDRPGPSSPKAPEPGPRSGPDRAQAATPNRGSGAGPAPEQPRRRWWRPVVDPDAAPPTPKEPKFRTRSGGDGRTRVTARRLTKQNDEGKEYALIEITAEASFRVPRAGSAVVSLLELLDVTDAARGPVPVHEYSGDPLETDGPLRIESQSTAPSANSALRRTYSIPVPNLHSPYRGDRTIRALFVLHRPRSPEQRLAQGWVEFPHRQERIGYVEAPQIRLRTEAGIVTAGFAAILADGEVDAEELSLLERFLHERHRRAPDGQRLAEAARQALDDARRRVQSGVSARELLQQAGRDLADAEAGSLATAYELAVRIMAVDGRITESELERLNDLAEILSLDAATTAPLRNRHTNVGMFEGESADPLGVPAGSPDEQRRFLREQLRTWRPVLTNPDPEKRKQAQEMIDRITARIEQIDRGASEDA